MSIAEARQGPRMIRASAFRNPLAGLALIVFARRALYCWPILTDLAGDGYFFSPLSRKVIYTFKGEQDEILSSFETFVDFLVAVSLRSPRSQLARIEAEQELRSEYANRGA